jgi:hypothetical protein
MLMSAYHKLTTSPDAELERSEWKLRFLSLLFVLGMFVLMEAMRYALVSDLGRHKERLLAEAISSVVFGLVLLKWLESTYRRRQQALAQMRRVLEVNDRIRNALEMISLSAYVTRNEEAIRVISEGVNRIEFVLREVLPGDFYFEGGAWRHAVRPENKRETAGTVGNGG